MFIHFLLGLILTNSKWDTAIVEELNNDDNITILFYDKQYTAPPFKNYTFCCLQCAFNHISNYYTKEEFIDGKINLSEYEEKEYVNFFFIKNMNRQENTGDGKIFITKRGDTSFTTEYILSIDTITNHSAYNDFSAGLASCTIS